MPWHPSVQAAFAQHAGQCLEDLTALGDADAVQALRGATEAMGCGEESPPTHQLDAWAAAATALFGGANDAGGFQHPAQREAYVLLQMALADRWHADGEAADATRALRAVDMAFIMGGPVESLQQLLRTVEPCARASLRPQPDALNASPLPDATPGPVPTTPLLSGAADGWRAEGSHIPRVAASELSVKEFKKQFFKADKPVVIEGCMEGWAALHKWSEPCWWRREHGHRTVPIELGVHAAGTLRERLMTLAEFVDEHLDRAPEEETACCPAYLAQHTLLDQIPQLMDDVTVPVYCQAGSHEVTNLWLGTAATATTLHFDSYDNLLCQVAGYKYVRLYAPAQSGKLYQDQRGHQGMATRSQGNLSQVDVGNVDTDRFPLFEQAPFLDAVLRSGDVLYIPSRWWHYVRSLSASCTCNFWF